jgi:hypothetical protein
MTRARTRAAVRVAAVALALGTLACASAPAPPPSPAPPSSEPVAPPADAVEQPAQAVEQRLYRLVLDRGEGRVSLRVVLRATDGPRYQIAVSDVAGRAVWGLDFAPGRSVLVDHRERLFCVEGSDVHLTEVHPEEVPLAALPRILRGELPVEPPADAGASFRDAQGRRWGRTLDGETLRAWTLYDAAGPAVWWTRDEEGGILSRRGGEQYRWVEVVAEPAAGPLPDIVPAGFTEGVCSD